MEKDMNQLERMLRWPFEYMATQIKSWKEGYQNNQDRRINEQISHDIRIEDMWIDGKAVVALTVHGVVVDYVRHSGDINLDPEGYSLPTATDALILKMQEIRSNEYVRQKMNR